MMNSLCQECFNFDCPWHKRFDVVEGWTATPTTVKGIDGRRIGSYCVYECPLFRSRDGDRWRTVTIRDIACIVSEHEKVVYSKIREGRIAGLLAQKGYEFKTTPIEETKKEHYFVKNIARKEQIV